jgi:DNA-binding transcriptional regulator YbjK
MSRWVYLALAIAGCGAAPPPAPVTTTTTTHATPDAAPPADAALEDDLPRLAERAVKLYADWERALADANGDCAAATAKLNAVADANADVIAANAKVLRSGHDKVTALREALEPHAAEMDASAKAIVQSPTMAACHGDAAFAHAIDRLGGDS